jgi:hypothetical protein
MNPEIKDEVSPWNFCTQGTDIYICDLGVSEGYQEFSEHISELISDKYI